MLQTSQVKKTSTLLLQPKKGVYLLFQPKKKENKHHVFYFAFFQAKKGVVKASRSCKMTQFSPSPQLPIPPNPTAALLTHVGGGGQSQIPKSAEILRLTVVLAFFGRPRGRAETYLTAPVSALVS